MDLFLDKKNKVIVYIIKNFDILIILTFLLYVVFNMNCKWIIEDSKLLGIKNGVFQKKDTLTSITIPDSVMIITNTAFRGCKKLASIDMPNTVTRIDSLAFSDCSLEEIKLSSSLKEINGYTFAGCNLSTIEIPDEVTYIGRGAFEDCKYLKYVKLPQNLEIISDEAFSGCERLADIQIPDRVFKVGNDAFASANCLSRLNADEYGSFYLDGILIKSQGDVSDIIVKEGTTAIAAGVFTGRKKLYTVKLPNDLLGIGEKAFAECDNLSYVNFPENLKYIGAKALTGTDISDAKLPEGLELCSNAFYDCKNLTNVILPSALSSVGDTVFRNTPWMESLNMDEYGCIYADYILLSCEGNSANLIIRPGTKIIAAYAAANCSAIENIEFPEGLLVIGGRAFSGCMNIKQVTLPKSLKTLQGLAFFPQEIEAINLPEGLETLGDLPFVCSAKEIIVPKSVVEISDYAFDRCRKLKTLKIPEHLRGSFIYDGKAKIIYY